LDTLGYFCEAVRALQLDDLFRRFLIEDSELRSFYPFVRFPRQRSKLDTDTVDDTSVGGGRFSTNQQDPLGLQVVRQQVLDNKAAIENAQEEARKDELALLKAEQAVLKAEQAVRKAQVASRLSLHALGVAKEVGVRLHKQMEQMEMLSERGLHCDNNKRSRRH
jgi:hypothetical protein